MTAELYKPLETMFSLFKFVGMWQDGNQSWTYFILGYLVHFSFIELCLLGELICAYHDESLVDLIETLGLTFTYIAEMLKCWNFFLKLKIIQKAFETLQELVEFSADERWKNRQHLKSKTSFGFKVYKIFWASAWTTCFASAIVPFTTHTLPYKVWFPFDTQTSFVGFWGASIYLAVSSFVVSAIDISLDTLPVFFMVFAIGLTNELSERLAAIGKIRKKEDTAEEFKKCIEIHWKIKKLVEEVQQIFSSVILVQGFFSSLILCMGTFSMSTVSFIRFRALHLHRKCLNLVIRPQISLIFELRPQVTDVSVFFRITTLMIPMILEIFLPCYFGNELSIASSKLSTALFHSDWTNCDKKLRQSMKIFIENTKKEMKVSAFGVFEVNLASFSRILNSAYSLFAILKRVNN
jgi:hypothetical protein